MLKKIKINKFTEVQIQLFFFMVFICIGALYANLNVSKHMDDYNLIFDFFNNKMASPIIVKTDLFEFLLVSRMKILLGLWIIGFVLFASYIDYIISGFFGFNFGLILSSALIYNGFNSFNLIIVLLLPQCIIYAPIFIYITSKNVEFSKALYRNRKTSKSLKLSGQLLFEYFLVLVICSVFTLIGITLEAYVNPDLIKWYISIKSF
ncbi:MAG: hypothetical protein CVU84_02915 [Firmicutes bacterium HGW-Firmicutes-1]|nr:MAG: hypothetical protein CVU84_02915 [Firmicutes bacterium HGW-Firmicutes-1]